MYNTIIIITLFVNIHFLDSVDVDLLQILGRTDKDGRSKMAYSFEEIVLFVGGEDA